MSQPQYFHSEVRSDNEYACIDGEVSFTIGDWAIDRMLKSKAFAAQTEASEVRFLYGFDWPECRDDTSALGQAECSELVLLFGGKGELTGFRAEAFDKYTGLRVYSETFAPSELKALNQAVPI